MTLRFSAVQLVATMFARTAQIRWKRDRRWCSLGRRL